MERFECNRDWSFYESNESLSFVYEKPVPKQIHLPHDFIITKPRSADAAGGALNGYFGEGQGVYKKELAFPESLKNKTVILDLDGAYMNTEVILNGELLGMHPYGYTPYQVDLTPALNFDGSKNELKIITQSRQPSSRWYTGGGLYRGAALWIGGSIYLKPWDTFISVTEEGDGKTVIHFDVTVTSRETEERELVVLCEVLDEQGGSVENQPLPGKKQLGNGWSEEDSRIKAARSVTAVVPALGKAVCKIEAEISSPHRWDIHDPYLYTCRITVMDSAGHTLDTEKQSFGIRTISVDTEQGFRLNGKAIKLKGGCIHHDNGLLGACAYPRAEERKIRLLREAGYNAVRISHHPPSLAMLEACDRLGMLLLDECFDVWRMGKRPMDYHLYFEDWWERDMEWMVKRDRNHPCVILYSTGNEIGERDGRNDGAKWSRRLSSKVKSLDSTRPVMAAICNIFEPGREPGTNFDANVKTDARDIWGEKTREYAAPLDITGYNYLPGRYEKDHESFPERVMAGTESHSFTTWDYWEKTKACPWVIGDFIWAAIDYLGEAGVGRVYWKKENETFSFMGPYPWRTSWQSDIMMTGSRRPQSYYRELMWGHTNETYLFTTHPNHYGDEYYGTGWHWPDVHADWSFGEEYTGRMVSVLAYGPGTEAEFRLNGKVMGVINYEKLTAAIDIPYTPGILEAVSYRNGKEISRAVLRTVGKEAVIDLKPEVPEILANGCDPGYIQIRIQDENGTAYPEDERLLTAELSDHAELIAIGSGSPCTEDQIGAHSCHAFLGEALLIIKAHRPGIITVAVYDENGNRGTCTMEAK
ncbi:DUF4982 domain-containing protein [Hungatella hathewayi]|uniref:glycoside hydrolase family 2 protein n=1 Tax=Hungatella hathewayi TaxID=154046 RepID=UPI00210E4962|nr:glycoside hydrolase family 2 TIM barrel-domain containing protein [Hungatella hathewayi]MCQ5386780.1 DUF4982 domain-containing protein [Hungatella hathewayi]